MYVCFIVFIIFICIYLCINKNNYNEPFTPQINTFYNSTNRKLRHAKNGIADIISNIYTKIKKYLHL